jgi:hypothetical protein
VYSVGWFAAEAKISLNSTLPKTVMVAKMARRNPRSPMRLTMNALLPAAAHHSCS